MARIVPDMVLTGTPLRGTGSAASALWQLGVPSGKAGMQGAQPYGRPVDFVPFPRDHAQMEFEDASPRARPGDLIKALAREDLDPLSVAELDERIAALTAEIERARMKRERAVNHKASAEALFRK